MNKLIEKQNKQIADLQALVGQLQQDLIEFGGHQAGCLYSHGKEYGCKCGWLEVEIALAAVEKMEKYK